MADDGAGPGEIARLREQLAQAHQRIAELNAQAPEPPHGDAAFLQSLLASSTDCIKVLDLDGKLMFMSEAGQRIMDVEDIAAILGRPWPEFWQGEHHAEAEAALATAQTGGVGSLTGMAPTMAGTPKWWQVHLAPIRDPAGRLDKLLAVSRDITAAHHAAGALREAQGLNIPILTSSRDCTVVLDLDGNTLFVSPGGIEAMEVSDVEAILGLSWLRVWTGADHEAARDAVAQARAGGVGRFEGFCPTHKGRPKWWDVMISPLPGPDGRPERLVAVGRDITDRKRADDEARRLAGLVEQSRDFIAMADPAGRVLFVNPAGLDMIGAPDLQAACDTPLPAFLAPDDQGALAAKVLPALRRHGFWEGELSFRHQRTGAGLPVLVNVFALRDAEATITGYGTVTRDLRDIRKADIRRVASLELGERLRDMEDIGAMSFMAAEIIGRTLGVSGAGFGTIAADGEFCVVERDWTAPGIASLAGAHRMADYGSFLAALRRGETVSVADASEDHRTASNAAPWLALETRAFINVPLLEHTRLEALFFVVNALPRAWGAQEVAFVRNVAERTRSAIQRRRAETGLRALAASLERQVAERTADRNRLWQLSTDIMLVAQFDGEMMAVNPAWTVMLGWSEQDLVGRRLHDFVHDDDLPAARTAALALAGAATPRRFELRMLCRLGGERWIAWTAIPGDGLINAVGRDITAEKAQAAALHQAEERLRHSQKMEAVGQLTGGLAHDFNNLLTGITGSLELLGTRLSQGRVNDLDRYITAAQGAARRAAALTHRLLAFSRRQTLDPKPTNVNRLVADMADMIGRTVGPAITVEVVGAAGLWPALVDPNQLENALLNLCINARDAMPDGGRLTIETANKWLDEHAAEHRDLAIGQYLSLCVTDTGTGMAPETIKRAFDPFFTTKPLGQGTGLGLSMIYGFARQSGGQVRVYSELGRGTTMCLYLPRHRGDADVPRVEEQPSEPLPAGQGETVLIVDDEPTVRMLVTEVLEDLGYVAIEAVDGAGGLAVLQTDRRIDLLVTDVGLPGGMNGRQMADAARALRPQLKVLFITGYAENAIFGNGHLDPGMHVLTKPFALEGLASRIKDLIAAG